VATLAIGSGTWSAIENETGAATGRWIPLVLLAAKETETQSETETDTGET
jgi:hypothetical protein